MSEEQQEQPQSENEQQDDSEQGQSQPSVAGSAAKAAAAGAALGAAAGAARATMQSRCGGEGDEKQASEETQARGGTQEDRQQPLPTIQPPRPATGCRRRRRSPREPR